MQDEDEIDVERWRLLLLEKRDALIEEGDVGIDPNRSDPTERPDEDAQPLNEMNQVIASKRNKQRALVLEKVKNALARLEQDPDEFGYCLDCEEPIKQGRLEVMPWALYCVRCEDRRNPRVSHRRRHILDFDD